MGAGASAQNRPLHANGGDHAAPPSTRPSPPRIGRNTIAPLPIRSAHQTRGTAYPDVQLKILFIGLDNAGKTCILHRVMHRDDVADVRPTNGFSRHTIELELKRQALSKREARDMARRAQHSISMQFDSTGAMIPAVNSTAPPTVAILPKRTSADSAMPQTPPPVVENLPHSLLAPPPQTAHTSIRLPPNPHQTSSSSSSSFSFPDFSQSFRHSMALPAFEGETLQVRETHRRYSDTIENSEDNMFSRRRMRAGEEEPDLDDAYSTQEQFEMFEERLVQNRSVRLQSHEVDAVSQATQFARDYHRSRLLPFGSATPSAPPPSAEHNETGGGRPQAGNVDLITPNRRRSNAQQSSLSTSNLAADTDANHYRDEHGKSSNIHLNHSVSMYSRPVQPFNPLPYASQLARRHLVEVFDLGGNANIRQIWEKYYAEVYGVVFVVDAADRTQVEEARQVLHATFHDVRLAGKPFLLLFNKKDVIGCLRDSELVDLLQLRALAEAGCLAAAAAGNDYRIRIHIEGATVYPSHIRNNTRRRELLRRTVLDGLRWLVSHILDPDHFNELLAKVQHDSHVQHLHDQREQLEKLERYQRLREESEKQHAFTNGDGDNDGRVAHHVEDGDDGQPFRPIQELIIHTDNANESALNRRRSSTSATSFQAMDLQHQRRKSHNNQRTAPAPVIVNDRAPTSPIHAPPPPIETVVEEIVTETHTTVIEDPSNTLSNGGANRRANSVAAAQANGNVVARNSKKQPLYRRPTTKKDIERIRGIALQHVSDDAVIE